MVRQNKQPRDKQTSYRPLLQGAELSICTDSEKLILLEKVRENDKIAIEKIILSHIRLAISIVNRYIGLYGLKYYANDLDSVAMEGIVVAVNQIAKGKMADHNNVTGFIVKYIHSYITNAIKHISVIYVPRGKKLIEPPINKDAQLSNQEFDTWDSIDNLVNSELEKEILKLRGASYTDAEIGKLVKISRLQVFRIRRDLFRRYQRNEHS